MPFENRLDTVADCLASSVMLCFTSDVRRYMQACRRAQPIPLDFQHALDTNQISTTSLEPHLRPPVPPSISQRQLPSPPPEPPRELEVLPFLGPALSGATDDGINMRIPKHFPPLPSKHTYHAEPVYTEREQDPRKIREQATLEARLGEEALRKFVGAARGSKGKQFMQGSGSKFKMSKRQELERLFEETLRQVKQSSQGESQGVDMDLFGVAQQNGRSQGPLADADIHSGPIVNCEAKYWRKRV